MNLTTLFKFGDGIENAAIGEQITFGLQVVGIGMGVKRYVDCCGIIYNDTQGVCKLFYLMTRRTYYKFISASLRRSASECGLSLVFVVRETEAFRDTIEFYAFAIKIGGVHETGAAVDNWYVIGVIL